MYSLKRFEFVGLLLYIMEVRAQKWTLTYTYMLLLMNIIVFGRFSHPVRWHFCRDFAFDNDLKT
jgi:hypothetical protein